MTKKTQRLLVWFVGFGFFWLVFVWGLCFYQERFTRVNQIFCFNMGVFFGLFSETSVWKVHTWLVTLPFVACHSFTNVIPHYKLLTFCLPNLILK